MSGINVIMGSLSPMLVNQPDLTRYVQKPRDAGLLPGGVWVTAYWNPWDLLDAILDHYWTPGARAGVFFVSFAFLLAVVATNLGCNSIPFGADITVFSPGGSPSAAGKWRCRRVLAKVERLGAVLGLGRCQRWYELCFALRRIYMPPASFSSRYSGKGLEFAIHISGSGCLSPATTAWSPFALYARIFAGPRSTG
ncbi:hypothetical protein GGTG_08985 [Gaeumannomyces tritici R3-111a-1]|uniref:Uncharacterized protein n=1 Tax=Gaeumannomyces tritici (strain R3-111a-1) TaxID=644352 RepID=J3P644_GAET3|nr:hypothetical protein GGTG_08985 [Gaeumannomyces tritici R3-111a-1]EJT72117.1 hypothetical protein GGTG_08985 [Gaeumannomyces tritici R3-111a-1]